MMKEVRAVGSLPTMKDTVLEAASFMFPRGVVAPCTTAARGGAPAASKRRAMRRYETRSCGCRCQASGGKRQVEDF